MVQNKTRKEKDEDHAKSEMKEVMKARRAEGIEHSRRKL